MNSGMYHSSKCHSPFDRYYTSKKKIENLANISRISPERGFRNSTSAEEVADSQPYKVSPLIAFVA